MKYFVYLIVVLVILAIGLTVYLNRAYAHIFKTIHTVDLIPPKITDYIVEPEKTTPTSTITYVALGDSLTAGDGIESPTETFPALIGKAFADRSAATVHVVNLGIPGGGVTSILDSELPVALSAKPDIVTVLIGTNDMFNRVPLATFQNNLTILLQKLSGVKKIIVFTVPDLGNSSLMLLPYQSYFAQKIDDYNNAIRGAGSGFANVEIVDLHALQATNPLPNDFYGADGFHPSAAGYRYWSNLIYAHLDP